MPDFSNRNRKEGHGEIPDEELRKNVKKVKVEWRIRLIIKSIILLLILLTFVILGLFRQEVMIFDMISNKVPVLIQNPITGDNLLAPQTTTEALWAFILITLLFPLIGGICASLGLDKVQNALELSKAKWKLRSYDKRIAEALKQLMIAQDEKEKFKSYLEWCTSTEEDFVVRYSNYFISCYNHGYEKGWNELMPEDSFELASLAYSKHVATKASKLFSKLELTN